MPRIAPKRTRHRQESRSRLDTLGLATASTGGLIRQVEKGFPFSALHSLETRSGIPVATMAPALGIPPRTLARRKATGKLSWDESERLLRIATVFEQAVGLFEGDVPAAASWLTTPRKAFEDRTPLAYSRTEVGANEVRNLIGRLEHGSFS